MRVTLNANAGSRSERENGMKLVSGDVLQEDFTRDTLKELGKYPAKAHARRVAKELGVDAGLIYLPGAPMPMYEDSDMYPAFRQRRYFYYLSGANFAGCTVVYNIGTDTLKLFIPRVEPRELLWFGKTPSIEETEALCDVDEVLYNHQLETLMRRHWLTSENKDVYVLHADQLPEPHSGADIIIGKLQKAMNRVRVVKTDYEVAMIRNANRVSSLAHRKVAEHFMNMSNEADIQAMILGVCTAKGAKMQSYQIIAGAGVNASTLHYEANDQPLKGKKVVVVDAGCEWDIYASDITRSLPIDGSWTGRPKAIHSLVQKMQEECISRVKPGVEFIRLHNMAMAIAVDGLLDLGILQGDREEILRIGTGAAFFPHGLGHHVGLEVHDVEGEERLMSPARSMMGKRTFVKSYDAALLHLAEKENYRGRTGLQPNMVITVEPGIYFCREYIEGYFLVNSIHAKFINEEVLADYYEVGGIRIEDCILVTEEGYENLTSAPKGDDLVDVIRRGPVARQDHVY